MTPPKTLLQEAQDPQTSYARLMGIYNEVDISVNRDQPYPERHFDTVEALAGHPSMPLYLVERLAERCPKAVLSSPELPRLLRENPEWAQGFQCDTMQSLLRFENVPAALLSAFADKTYLLGKWVRMHVGLAGEAGSDWKEGVQEALWDLMQYEFWQDQFPAHLVALDLVPDWLLEPLASHYDAEVRRAVARHPHTPPGVLTLLQRAGSTSDLSRFAPPDLSLPTSALERLARGGPWAKRLAARHPNTPPEMLERLAESIKVNAGRDHQWAAKMVARSLIQHPGTLVPLRKKLAERLVQEALSAVKSYESQLGGWADSDIALSDRLLAAQNLNSSPLESYLKLARLAQDPDFRVRQAVGLNAAAEERTLALLADDPVREVRLAVAYHPQALPHLLEWLAEDDAEEVRQAATHRLETAPPAPEPLPMDINERAQALDYGIKTLGFSLGGSLRKVVVLACPDTPLKILMKGAVDEDWLIRLAVARNPVAPLLSLETPGTEDVLRSLSHDGNRFVRAAAQAALAPIESV